MHSFTCITLILRCLSLLGNCVHIFRQAEHNRSCTYLNKQNQQTRELITAWRTSQKYNNKDLSCLKWITWHACKYRRRINSGTGIPTWQVKVTVGHSSLCCRISVTSFECYWTSLFVDCAQVLWASFHFRKYSRTQDQVSSLTSAATSDTDKSPMAKIIMPTAKRIILLVSMSHWYKGNETSLCNTLVNWKNSNPLFIYNIETFSTWIKSVSWTLGVGKAKRFTRYAVTGWTCCKSKQTKAHWRGDFSCYHYCCYHTMPSLVQTYTCPHVCKNG